MLQGFKDFVMRGNVMDLAVGVIIGAAFGKIVDSAVGDMIMPVAGLFTGGIDFSNLFVNLGSGTFASLEEARKAGAPILAYGSFINTVFNFLILAAVIYMMVSWVNKLKKAEPPPPPPGPSTEEKLLTEIRDAIRGNTRAAGA